MRPDHGGRIELKLSEGGAASARYALTIFTPQGEPSTQVSVDALSGALELDEWQGEAPPEWLQAYAKALVRTALRTKNSDGDWPRRLTRWRPEPKP